MTYAVPYIDAAGLHIPTYNDIMNSLIDEAKNIFGQDVYLESDAADYQLLSVISLKIYESNQAIQLAYNNRSPQTGTGSGLDMLLVLNGLKRKEASYSTCQVILTGTSGTIITDGMVRDTANYVWALPSPITIPEAGTIEVTAQCLEIGAIEATVGTIIKINTPTSGWLSVTNSVQAVAGKAIESDAELKARQAVSVQLPSQTLLEGTKAGILTVANVTKVRLYDNDDSVIKYEINGVANPGGFPPNSLTAVVEGGLDSEVAEQIYLRKGIGALTNGTTKQTVIDSSGQPNTIRFYRPTYQDIYVSLTITKLYGWQPALETLIQEDLTAYLNGLGLGENISISALWGIVLSRMPDLKTPIFTLTSLTAGKTSETLGSSDIAIPFNTTSTTTAAKIVITLV